MALDLQSVLKNFNHANLTPSNVSFDPIKDRVQQVVGVEYYFEMVPSNPAPIETVIANIKRSYSGSGSDRLMPFYIGSIEEGVQLTKEFCAAVGVSFKQIEQDKLTRNVNRRSTDLYLIIIERPILNG